MFCRNCGKQLYEGMNYCCNCASETSYNVVKKEEKKDYKNAAKKSIGMYFLLWLALPIIIASFIRFDGAGDIVILFGVFAIIALIVVPIINRDQLKEYFKGFKAKYIGYGILTWFIMIVCSGIAITIVEQFIEMDTVANQEAIEESFNHFIILNLIIVVAAAPILEEIVFRMNLRSIIKSDILFLLASTWIFGALHTIDILNGIVYYVMGFVLAFSYLKTKNIYVPMITHLIQNVIAALVIVFSIL